MSNKNNSSSLKVKILIAVASLIFFLALLEIALRIIGHVYLSRETIHYGDLKSSDYVILCVGDSFTWGGSVTRDETYAAYLSKLLNSRSPQKKFLVINKGKCEYNSSQVLKSLPRWFKEYRPNMVILLVGSSNRFNPWGYNSYAAPSFLSNLKDTFDSLRLVKMLRLIAVNFKAKLFYWDAEHVFKEEPRSILGYNYYSSFVYRERGFNYIEDKKQIKSPVYKDKLSMAWYYFNIGEKQKAIALLQALIKDNPHSLEALCALAYGYYSSPEYFQKAEEVLQQAQRLNPQSEFVRCQLDSFYRVAQKFYQKNNRLDLALEYFKKAIELSPDDYGNYYNLSRAYELQSKYNADFVIDFLQRMLQTYSRLKDNALFMAYLGFFEEKKHNEDKINKWLENDLDKIVALCRKNNANMLIQNYPFPYPIANNALENLASKYSLAFVNNLETFNQFALREESADYLTDDSHCTAKGHEVMAENIYNTLISRRATSK
ncbi:MAG: tetratricopeptide repeat protein [Candidatus Omnitrophota bacterium]